MSPSHGDNRDASERPLNMNDLSDAVRLPKDERMKLMQGILADLQAIEAPTSRDAAGIAHRGALVFREHLDGRSIKELAAAYIELRMLGVQTGVVDAIETAVGIPDLDRSEALTHSSQAQIEKAYREQMKRYFCPGCGDDDVFG